MNEAENLRTIAEVAITIAGFTGVVVVFGSRSRGEWTQIEANSLWLLLSQALTVTLFSFLPILLDSGDFERRFLWRLSNGLLAVATWVIAGHMAFSQQYLRHASSSSSINRGLEFFSLVAGGAISLAQFAHSAGAAPTKGPFLYLLALLFLLAGSITNFWRLLMGSVAESRPKSPTL